jgi:hypothetical protein
MQILKVSLIILFGFELKHFLADFTGLQTKQMLANKGNLLKWGGYEHAFVHAALTALVVWVLCAPWLYLLDIDRMVPLLVRCCLLEFVWHWLTDYIKATVTQQNKWQTSNQQYWVAMGLDQLSHQCCYILLVWYLAPAII